MKKVFLTLMVASVATSPGLNAQETKKGSPERPEATNSTASAKHDEAARGDDEKAIKVLLDAFTKAFNVGDATAAADTYAETAIVVDEQGERTEGRAAIGDHYARSFADNPGSKISIQVEALRFLGPETAIEVGRTTITPAADTGAPEVTRFTAVYVKNDNRWLQSAVRDEVAHDVAPHERLKDLEWLVGDWVNESQDAVVTTTCKWSKGGNFIDREFSVQTKGQPVLSGTQRIGWDPLKKQFKSWIFDSEGGHGEGFWTRDGNQWVIKVDGVRQDGQPASATNIITRLGKDRLGWQSTERTLGGALIPGVEEFVVVRTPPEVGK
ncbi:YybH family protein (plasmid) [Tundrisphaera lichenicola]|uniref:YybH family protein n=1 Tax=Tundrisphaera lichenicola TaxID=2029860 RepID=UPI003EB6ABC0